MATETRQRAQTVGSKYDVNRKALDELMRRRFFIAPAFSAYQGLAGLFDFGPAGCTVKTNIINQWKRHFVLHDSMLEVDCTVLTPKCVLDASGHTAKFSDYMVRDVTTKQCYRADHVLKNALEAKIAAADEAAKKDLEVALARVDELDMAELGEALKKYGVKAPDTGNDLTDPAPFNLMFQTSIGPAGDVPGFLRPETAQGIFVNFKKLLDYNGGKLPFAAAQCGSAFRNEIAPRSGLLRVREFPLAEIEYFCKPDGKEHKDFHEVSHLNVSLLPAEEQEKGALDGTIMNIGEAVEKHIIKNNAIGYFVGRTYLFLTGLGIPAEHLRFRQHLRSEMAHYASDCWDAEIRTSYGWVECVGHADRMCFDLTQHTNCSQENMTVHESFKEGPRMVEKFVATPNKGALGKAFRKEAQAVIKALEELDEDKLEAFAKAQAETGSFTLNVNGKDYAITADMVKIAKKSVKVTGVSFIPHVIEPSFGMGRIFYCVMEHAFWTRPEDPDRGVLSLPPAIAPVKVSVFPLQNDERFGPLVSEINKTLTRGGISTKVDETGTAIGRRYARTDELGIPFAITVDYDTLEDRTVTLRERDSMAQVRMPIADILSTINQLCDHTLQWSDILAKYPAVTVAEK